MMEQPSMAGRVLAGRYRLEERLGEGGMGAIWRAQHLVLCAPVAVKLIDPEIADDEESRARFMREAQAAAALRSPHVVQILDYGVDEKLPFIVMELMEGETLAQRLKRAGRLSPQDTAWIVTHIARAIGRAHEAQVVHRDLKPENVFLVHNEDEDVAKVLDFGVAKIDSGMLGPRASQTRTGSLLGTPYYMSPEQAQGNKLVDYRSDLWSLGVIAFECLTGKRPFFSDGLGDLVLQICVRPIVVPSEVAPVPPGFDEWFARAVAREPEQRFQSAREMAESLRETLGVEGRETGIISSDYEPAKVPVRAEIQSEPSTDRAALPRGWVESAEDVRSEAIATTIPASLRPDSEPASKTVRQFGTSAGRDASRKRGGAGLVLAVAAGALATGVAAGLVWLSAEPSVIAPPERFEVLSPRPAGRVPGETLPETRRVVEQEAAAEPAPVFPEQRDAEAASETDASESRPLPQDAAAAVEQPRRGPPAERAGTSGDGGWTKPAWAMPDEEADPAPRNPVLEPEPEPPVSGDNPY